MKSVISLSNDFLNVFTSFGEMLGGVLGFDTNTKKSDVGAYFKTVHDIVSSTKTSLNKIVADMKSENNPNADAVNVAVKKLVTTTLDKIIAGAKTASEAIGSDASDPIGNVAVQNDGGVAGEVDKLVKGIKSIVDVVLQGKGNPEAGDNKKAEDRGARDNDVAGKLFANNNAGAADAAKKSAVYAAKAVGAVTSADILQAIAKSNDAVTLAKHNEANGNSANGKKDAVVAGGIALRAMAKEEKFAGPSNAAVEYATAVKGAAISAVTKALDTLTIAIRNTIDAGLKEVKDSMKINPEDTPVTTDNTTSETKKN